MPAALKEKKEIPEAQVYVLQGDDELSIAAAVRELSARHAAGDFAGMNFVRLDGRTASRADVASNVNVLPLGGASRLVVLDEALEFIKGKEDFSWLEALVAGKPPSTIMVIVIKDSQKYKGGKMVWQLVGPVHALREKLKNAGGALAWMEYPKPQLRQMPEWIANQAIELNIQMEGRAAAELANLVGDDLYLARQEIIKAATYAGAGQAVTRDMIRLLCSPSREEDIFAMVDAAGQRNPAKALSLLHTLLRDQPVQQVFSMVVRQFRLLITAKDVIQAGGDEKALSVETGMHAFVAKKLVEQAARFSMAELVTLFRQLDRMDEESKIGIASLEVMLETLLADLKK